MADAVAVREAIEQRIQEIEAALGDLRALERERDVLRRTLRDLQEEGPRRAVRASGPPRQRARSRRRAARGSNLQSILEYVAASPDATARTIADATGIDRSVIYSAVSRLTSAGQLERRQDDAGKVTYRVAGEAPDSGHLNAGAAADFRTAARERSG